MVAHAVKGEAADGPGRHSEFLDQVATRFAAGLASVIAVVDPAVVVLAGGIARAGGEALRARVEAELAQLAMARPAVVLSTLSDNPVLAGGLGAALDDVRDAVFATG
jgi:predicted NBD/HSP70 family sugar kinase